MTVAELIEFLKTQRQDLPVVYQCYSEYMSLEADDIKVQKLQPARSDGWVHHARPDRETIDHLTFPGN